MHQWLNYVQKCIGNKMEISLLMMNECKYQRKTFSLAMGFSMHTKGRQIDFTALHLGLSVLPKHTSAHRLEQQEVEPPTF